MSEDKQKMIFSKNLNSYVTASGKTQLEIAKSIGVSPQTFNTWCKGIAIPRMGKVQALADYFHINKSDLIEDSSLQKTTDPTSRVALLRRAEENEKLTDEQLDDILSYAKYRYPNAFKDNE